jgi:hypothetical protein
MFDLCNNVDYVGLRVTKVLEQMHAPLVKAHYNERFWKSQWYFLLGESSIIALYSNLFEKLGKNEMKI